VSSEENRRHERHDVEGVDGTLVVSLEGRVLNMSLTGLAVETTSMLRLGATYWLRLPRGGDELRFKATVAWCHLERTRKNHQGESVPVYHAGLDFRESLDERTRQMLVFLKEHSILEVGERIAGRFQPRHKLSAELSVRYPFEVRRLSLSGMLIETEFAPELGDTLEMEIDGPTGSFSALGAVRYLQPTSSGPADLEPGSGARDRPEAARHPSAAPASSAPAPSPGASATGEAVWMAGIEFARLDPDARDRLGRLVQSLHG
jgi:hypothetical protein